ncbi:hypothetical protein EI171_20285 [Bradyrhizobium sp. LCT2]|uniref:hypothetical protein n=1 Tax=Bradyrhizobium sp. LCT2 TaxID=2493093 RepID=UPI001373CE89|nr:hypothetical protein [Bradyrhizobium sp. LCT2]QHP69419.1 hypothetical protein EI171_20285 [Bradyrhizobium sp. LCT2]
MKTPDAITAVVTLFGERSAYWTSRGFFGAELYERLASDSELPENFDSKAVAAILGVKHDAMAQRRKRGDPPSFIRFAQNSVMYPRHALCLFLRDRFVERRPTPARREYTCAQNP